jgi:predicted Zn-dependent peptidase
MQLESRLFKVEDVGKQLLTYGKVLTPAEICANIEKVQVEDIHRVAKKLLITNPSLSAYGDLTQVPPFEQIQKALRQ